MQRGVVFTIWILFSFLAQSLFLNSFPTQNVFTDIVFYSVIVLGLRFNWVAGLMITFALGYGVDSLSFAPLGLATISYLVVYILLRKVHANIYMENRLSLFVWMLILSAVKQGVELIVLVVTSRVIDFGFMFYLFQIVQAFWTAALGIFIVPFIEFIVSKDWSRVFRKKGLVS